MLIGGIFDSKFNSQFRIPSGVEKLDSKRRYYAMVILAVIVLVVGFIVLFPLINKLMTQVVFKSKERTRKHLLEAYDFGKKKYPNASDKELLLYVIQASFVILDKKPDRNKPRSILTGDEVDQIVAEAKNIDNLVEIIVKRGLSPDLTPWI